MRRAAYAGCYAGRRDPVGGSVRARASPGAVDFVQKRLSALSKSLGDKPYLDGDRFTAGDLMMTTVLRILKHTDIVTSEKRLAAYVERCTARPAFKRAFDAQISDFREAA